MKETRIFNGVPVPWTVSWTGEGAPFIDACPFARTAAICQREAPGEGRPLFARPHFGRQRQVIAEWRCDLCGKPLKNRTMISMSKARPRHNAVVAGDVLQVEPLLHRECAAICVQHCPNLKRNLAAGAFEARRVVRARVQFAVANPDFISVYVPGYVATPGAPPVVAHAKVQLLKSVIIGVEDLTR